MPAHAYKFPPERAASSMGRNPQGVPAPSSFPQADPQADKVRLRTAIAAVKAAREGLTNDGLADELGIKSKRLNQMLESDPSRRVDQDILRQLEGMAAETRAGIDDSEIARVVRDYFAARAAFERLGKRLMEAA